MVAAAVAAAETAAAVSQRPSCVSIRTTQAGRMTTTTTTAMRTKYATAARLPLPIATLVATATVFAIVPESGLVVVFDVVVAVAVAALARRPTRASFRQRARRLSVLSTTMTMIMIARTVWQSRHAAAAAPVWRHSPAPPPICPKQRPHRIRSANVDPRTELPTTHSTWIATRPMPMPQTTRMKMRMPMRMRTKQRQRRRLMRRRPLPTCNLPWSFRRRAAPTRAPV